jgi:hypothetical protein
MTRGRRFRAILLAAALLFSGTWAAAEEPEAETVLADLYTACKTKAADAVQKVEEEIGQIREPVLLETAVRWKELFIDSGYKLYMNGRDKPEDLEIPDPSKHAFVVLGYCLRNGEMEPELQGRCKAAGTVAKAYPDAIVLCSGGATGSNNPNRNTEARLMRDYMIRKCGIAGDRILLDRDSLTTAENARNSLRILSEMGIETVTVVTSAYHQRWGSMLFYAAAAWYRKQGIPMEIIGNWCYNTTPAAGYDGINSSFAMTQLRVLLLTGEGALLSEPEEAAETPAEAGDAEEERVVFAGGI